DFGVEAQRFVEVVDPNHRVEDPHARKNSAASPQREAAPSPSRLLRNADAAAVGATIVRIAAVGRIVDAAHAGIARTRAEAAAGLERGGHADAPDIGNAAEAAVVLARALVGIGDEATAVHAERLHHLALTDRAVAQRNARVVDEVQRADLLRIARERGLVIAF